MSGGAISGREDFPRYNESGDVWAKVLEKVRKAEKKHQKFQSPDRVGELFESEAWGWLNQLAQGYK